MQRVIIRSPKPKGRRCRLPWMPHTTNILRTLSSPSSYLHADGDHYAGTGADADVRGAVCDGEAIRIDVDALVRSGGVGMGVGDGEGAVGKSYLLRDSRLEGVVES